MSSKIKFIDSSLSLAFFQYWTISFSVMPEIKISPYNSGFKFDIFRLRPKKTILLSLNSSCKSRESSSFASRTTVLKQSGFPVASMSPSPILIVPPMRHDKVPCASMYEICCAWIKLFLVLDLICF